MDNTTHQSMHNSQFITNIFSNSLHIIFSECCNFVRNLIFLLYIGKGKGKGKRGFVQRLVVNAPLRRSGMARVLKGSHSFTCTPRVHPLSE